MSASFENAASRIPVYKTNKINGHEFKIMTNYSTVLPIIEELGDGSNSKVWRVFDHRDNIEKAMKVVMVVPRRLESFLSEVEILKQVGTQIEGVPRYYEHFLIGGNTHAIQFAILMQYIDGYDLEKTLQYQTGVTDDILLKFGYWLFNLVTKLHDMGLVHNDIKPSNILIDNKNHFYLVDFGFACYVDRCSPVRKGSYMYMSPEAIKSDSTRQYGLKANDIWACGMVLLEMINLHTIYEGTNLDVLIKTITAPINVPDRGPISTVISGCLVPENQRWTARQCLEYLQDVMA